MEAGLASAPGTGAATPPARFLKPPSAPSPLPPSAEMVRTGITEFLAFKLGGEEYGIDILRVREIRSFETPTRMANAPQHILGVLNLRGLIVPIVDLRMQFALGSAAYDDFTVTIVLGIADRVVGVVVDGVSDVISLAPDQLRPVPQLRAGIQNDHLLAIGAIDQRMLILMDIEKLMTGPAMGLVNEHNPDHA